MGYTQKQHFPITEQPTLLTYRLAGSIHKTVIEDLLKKRSLKIEKLNVEILKFPKEKRHEVHERELFLIHGEHALAIDRILHHTKDGPFHLMEPEIRKQVLESWKFLHEIGAVFLYAICVMGNHVHVIVKAPEGVVEVDPGNLIKRHKSFTAREANMILKTSGEPFWDGAYDDRTIRAGKFIAAMWYVLNNPVKAGLVDRWSDWPGTFVHPDYVALFG